MSKLGTQHGVRMDATLAPHGYQIQQKKGGILIHPPLHCKAIALAVKPRAKCPKP